MKPAPRLRIFLVAFAICIGSGLMGVALGQLAGYLFGVKLPLWVGMLTGFLIGAQGGRVAGAYIRRALFKHFWEER